MDLPPRLGEQARQIAQSFRITKVDGLVRGRQPHDSYPVWHLPDGLAHEGGGVGGEVARGANCATVARGRTSGRRGTCASRRGRGRIPAGTTGGRARRAGRARRSARSMRRRVRCTRTRAARRHGTRRRRRRAPRAGSCAPCRLPMARTPWWRGNASARRRRRGGSSESVFARGAHRRSATPATVVGRGPEPDDERDRLVVVEYERWERGAGGELVAAADARVRQLDRVAEPAEPIDVAAQRCGAETSEALGELGARPVAARLEQRQQARGRGRSGSAMSEGFLLLRTRTCPQSIVRCSWSAREPTAPRRSAR